MVEWGGQSSLLNIFTRKVFGAVKETSRRAADRDFCASKSRISGCAMAKLLNYSNDE